MGRGAALSASPVRGRRRTRRTTPPVRRSSRPGRPAGRRVDVEPGHVAGAFVGDVQAAVGPGEGARPVTAAGHGAGEPQGVAPVLDREHRQHVLTARRGPQEPSVGRHDDPRRVGVAGRDRRQHRYLAQRLQRPVGGVPAADRDGRREFVDDVRVRAVGVEGQVARPGAGAQRALAVHGEGAVAQRTHPHRVGAKVDADRPPPARVGLHLVGVRPLLAGVYGPEPVWARTADAARARLPSGRTGSALTLPEP